MLGKSSSGFSCMNRTCALRAPASSVLRVRALRSICLGQILFFITPAQVAHASSWLERLDLSFETTQNSIVGLLRDHESLTRSWRQPAAVRSLGLPESAELAALAVVGNATYWAPDITVAVGSLTVRPRDIAVTTGATTSIFISGLTLDLPENSQIDAIALLGSDLYFSLDTSATIGSTNVTRNDILVWNGSAISIHRSGASLDISPSTNLAGLEVLSPASFLVSFSSGFAKSSLEIASSDIVHIGTDPAVTWSISRSEERLGVECSPCSVSAISASGILDVIHRAGWESHEF